MMVWACTENGRKENSQKSFMYVNMDATSLEVDQEIDGKMN